MEHVYRELAQMYECTQELEEKRQDPLIMRLPFMISNLILNGVSIEVMDGDNSFI